MTLRVSGMRKPGAGDAAGFSGGGSPPETAATANGSSRARPGGS
jgi:hypothetical protein